LQSVSDFSLERFTVRSFLKGKVYFLLANMFLTFCVSSHSKGTLSIEQWLSFQYPQQAFISPDSRQIIFTIRQADFIKSVYTTWIWKVAIDGGPPEQFIPFPDCTHPHWSPDGRFLAFLATPALDDKTNKDSLTTPQIWFIPAIGGERQLLSAAPHGVKKFIWSHDGKTIAYITKEILSRSDRLQLREDYQKKNDAYVFGEKKRRKQIWLIDIDSGINERLYEGDYGIKHLAFSPDAELLVFSTNTTGDFDDQHYDLWLVSVGSKSAYQLTVSPDAELEPQFSWDGHQIACLTQSAVNIHYAQTEIALVDIATGRSTVITQDFDYPIEHFQWIPGENTILFDAAVKTENHLFTIETLTREITQISVKKSSYNHDLSVSADGNLICYLSETASTLPEIMLYYNDEKRERQLTHFSDSLKVFQLGEQTVFHWKNPQGDELEGLLIKPKNFQPARKYPMILAIHGGPYARFKNRLLQDDYLQLFAQHGYIVLAPNPHGSSGYGQAFGEAIQYDIGGQDFGDIMSGVDKLIQTGLVDSTKMGLMGGSYGGYLVNWIIGHTSRFKAAVSMYGIFNLITDWSNSIQPSWEKAYLGAYYWEDSRPYRERSPSTHVKNIHTPVLLLHGETDQITSVCNSREIYQSLRVLGKPVEFVIYPREGHGILQEPNHQIDKVNRILSWFEKYLK